MGEDRFCGVSGAWWGGGVVDVGATSSEVRCKKRFRSDMSHVACWVSV